MRKRLFVAAIVLASGLLFTSCFEFSGEFTYTEIGDPNPAWVTIEYPTSEPTYVTNDNSIYLSGSAFVSETYLSGPPWDSGVAVKWSNSSGGNGSCTYYTDVLIPFIETKWWAYIPLSLGDNIITITAYEYLATPPDGYSRSKTITVTRN